ncbi:hypothetical protein GCM10010218_40960 [Streptomyces mashuensis]|uniref:Small hydrophobic membrane protein n=1 Tax=Streptomyces mashuensis TaxID=33904 RepID=A0A919B6J3_9ACTN|nr:hypothetical protein [Streptomyces mashuensis]GHF55300.1 hypothetical protein GCM10010218_40960 [Streptomyces mashuensis]
MLFLTGALFLLGLLSGTAAHVPVPVTLVSAAVICAWILLFAARERRRTRRRHRGARGATPT